MHVLRITCLPVLLLMISSASLAQNLDDFKNAAKAASDGKGIESVPFSDLRRDAGSIQKDIDSWKEKTATYKTWKEYERQKTNAYKNIKHENNLIKLQEDYISDLKSRGVDASVFEKELEEDRSKAKVFEEDLAKVNKEITEAADAWDRLQRLRGGMRETMDDVRDKLSSARSSPEPYLGSSPTDEDRKTLTESIETIQRYIEDEAKTHATAEQEAGNAMENLKKVLSKSSD